MPIFKATYVPHGIDFKSSTPDPPGSTSRTFSAPSYAEAFRKAVHPELHLRRIRRIDGGRRTVVFDTEIYHGTRPDKEDFAFYVLKCPQELPANA